MKMNSYNGRNQSRQSVKSKFIIAFIAFALILGAKAISSKSSSEDNNEEYTSLDY